MDYNESWVLKNWWFWTVVLEKILESPLDYKEIKAVHPKGNQSWIFTGRADAEAETPIFDIWFEELAHRKRPWFWERLRAGGEGDNRGWDGWMASLTWWTWVLSKLQKLVMYREAWCATVHGFAKSRKWLSEWAELNFLFKYLWGCITFHNFNFLICIFGVIF